MKGTTQVYSGHQGARPLFPIFVPYWLWAAYRLEELSPSQLLGTISSPLSWPLHGRCPQGRAEVGC